MKSRYDFLKKSELIYFPIVGNELIVYKQSLKELKLNQSWLEIPDSIWCFRGHLKLEFSSFTTINRGMLIKKLHDEFLSIIWTKLSMDDLNGKVHYLEFLPICKDTQLFFPIQLNIWIFFSKKQNFQRLYL